MLTFLINLLRKISGNITADQAISAMTKAMTKLDKAVVAQTDRAEKARVAAAKAAQAATKATDEAERARRIGTKLNDLLN